MSPALLFALSGCLGRGSVTDTTPTDPPSMSYEIVPPLVELGDVHRDGTVFQTFTVRNLGEGDLSVESIQPPEGVEATLLGPPTVPESGSTSIELAWTPLAVGVLDQEARIVLSSPYDTQTVSVPLHGTVRGGQLTLSLSDYDFGTTGIGCHKELNVTFTNTGNEPLVLDRISGSGDTAFKTSEFDVPLTLDPFESRRIDVEFVPSTPGPVTSFVELEGDDVYGRVSLKAEAVADGQNEQTWTVGKDTGGKMIVVFHIHGWFIPGGWSETYGHGGWASFFHDNLKHYFEVLQENGADYRLAFIWNPDGEVRGSVPYLDRSYTPEESVAIVFDQMLEGGVNTDYDLSWPLYTAAMKENQSWMEESPAWAESKLSFVLVHRDQEQSGILWSTALKELQSYREDKDLVTVNGITGPPPVGCDGGVVEYPLNYYEAVNASNGIILSACEPDWTSHWETLAAHTMSGSVFYSLQGTVLASSIKVWVDGRATNAWKYDESFNAVMFDDGNEPVSGSTVKISYLIGGECG